MPLKLRPTSNHLFIIAAFLCHDFNFTESALPVSFLRVFALTPLQVFLLLLSKYLSSFSAKAHHFWQKRFAPSSAISDICIFVNNFFLNFVLSFHVRLSKIRCNRYSQVLISRLGLKVILKPVSCGRVQSWFDRKPFLIFLCKSSSLFQW